MDNKRNDVSKQQKEDASEDATCRECGSYHVHISGELFATQIRKQKTEI